MSDHSLVILLSFKMRPQSNVFQQKYFINAVVSDIYLIMLMKFVEKILADSYEGKSYRLARALEIPIQTVQAWRGRAKKRATRQIALHLLCRLRRASGLTWQQFGELLDSEFSE